MFEVSQMEETRCRVATSATEDCRCKNLLDSGITESQDPRYKSLHRQVGFEIEDPRFNPAVMNMEDPRCSGISSMW